MSKKESERSVWNRKNVAWIITTGLTLCVGLLGWQTNKQANQIAQVQAQLDKQQSQIMQKVNEPQIMAWIERVDICKGQYAFWVQIENAGSRLKDITISKAVFLEVQWESQQQRASLKNYIGPMNTAIVAVAYLDSLQETHKAVGRLATFKASEKDCNRTYSATIERLRGYDIFGRFSVWILHAVIVVSYKDVLENQHIDAFDLTESRPVRIPDEWVKQAMSQKKPGSIPTAEMVAEEYLRAQGYSVSLLLEHRLPDLQVSDIISKLSIPANAKNEENIDNISSH